MAIEPIAKIQKNINLKISFKKVIESTGEADEEGIAQTNVSSQDIFEVKYLLGPQDTIASIESKLRVINFDISMYLKLKYYRILFLEKYKSF